MNQKVIKILFLLVFLGSSVLTQAQSNQYWISNPNLKGKLTFENGWTLFDTLTGIKLGGNLWLGGSSIFFSGGLILKDSVGAVVLNKAPKVTTGAPWIRTEDIADTSISGAKIKSKTITTDQFAQTTKDSIFGTSNVGTLSRNLQLLIDRYNVIFNSTGKIKPSVLGPRLSYDTTANMIKFDTTYFLKSRDSVKFLTGGIDTSFLLQKRDTSRFVSSVDVANLMPKSDSTRFVTGTGYIPRSDTASLFWTRTQFKPTDYWSRATFDTNQFVSLTDLPSLSADTSLFWSKNWNLISRSVLDSQRTADTTKWWTKAWKFINRTTLDSQRTADTNKFITTANLPDIWLKSVYNPSKFWTSDGTNGTKTLDTNRFISTTDFDTARLADTSKYWKKTTPLISRSTLDSQSVADTSTFWTKVNKFVNANDTVNGNRIITWSKLDTINFKKNGSNQLGLKDFSINPNKLDTSKIGFGLKYDGSKLVLNTSPTSTSEGIPTTSAFPILGFTTSTDTVYGKSCQYMTWIDDISDGTANRWVGNEIGYVALHDGAFITLGKNGLTPTYNLVTAIKDSVTNDFLKFSAGDYIQIYWLYETYGDEYFNGRLKVSVNGAPKCNVAASIENSIFTCSLEVLYF